MALTSAEASLDSGGTAGEALMAADLVEARARKRSRSRCIIGHGHGHGSTGTQGDAAAWQGSATLRPWMNDYSVFPTIQPGR